MFDATVIRKDFPVFERRVHGDKPLIYLDSAASTQRPRQVIEAMVRFEEQHYANVHRGVYQLAEEATNAYEGAREAIARFIGAPSVREIVFTRGTTEAINLVARTYGDAHLREGDQIVITEMEHHSNLIPWQQLRARTGVELVVWPVEEDGTLDLEKAPFNAKTKLVCITLMSNVLGTINPIADISAAAHAVGALVVCDAAQGVPHLPVDVRNLGCDFLALSGHKMLGPSGSGALWAPMEILEKMPPFLGGGEMILEVWMDKATYNEIPYRFEAGTPSITPQVGLGAAVEYLENIGMEDVRAHEVDLLRHALGRLGELSDLRIFGPTDLTRRGGVVSFWHDLVHPHDMAQILDTAGVCVRAGHHCAQPLMRRYGIPATTRASFHVYNTLEDVDRLVEAVADAEQRMGL
ncbi:MAG: cysteine desulfurase [Actinomycetota bacterium]